MRVYSLCIVTVSADAKLISSPCIDSHPVVIQHALRAYSNGSVLSILCYTRHSITKPPIYRTILAIARNAASPAEPLSSINRSLLTSSRTRFTHCLLNSDCRVREQKQKLKTFQKLSRLPTVQPCGTPYSSPSPIDHGMWTRRTTE
jgi:hypothetical protein